MSALLRHDAEAWLAAGRPAVVVKVAEVQGSAPREAGARMLVAADAIAGTIGGGHLELQTIAHAHAALAGHTPLERSLRFALGPALGQCCGGTVRLDLRPLDAAALADWPPAAPRFHLQLHGAGHVGCAIVKLLRDIDCRVQWVDERLDVFPPEPEPPHIERIGVDAPEAEVDSAPAGAHLLVMTHSHDLDLCIVERALRRDDLGFVGLIGSASKRARFAHRLLQRGVPQQRVAALACPIGLPGIRGKAPAVVAVSVVAQLLALSGGGD